MRLRARPWLAGVTALMALVLACALPEYLPSSLSPAGVAEDAGSDSTSDEAGVEPAATITPTPLLAGHEKLLWFEPIDHYPRPPNPRRAGFVGATDYMELFQPGASWQQAIQHVDTFTVYQQFVDWASEGEFSAMIETLDQNGIALGLETGVIPRPADCGEGYEGFTSRGANMKYARRIRDAGGQLNFIAFNNPYANASFYVGEDSCNMPPEEVARQAKITVQMIRQIFPHMAAGTYEHSSVGNEELMTWFDTYAEVNGEQLDFIHLDTQFTDPNWASQAKELEEFARSRGIHFGVTYTGNFEVNSDAEWVELVTSRIYEYELDADGDPDHVVLQSWQDRPDHVLPETDRTAFTYLIRQYTRPRTEITLEATATEGGSLDVSGQLNREAGEAVGDAPIELRFRPLEGAGAVADYAMSGTTPEEAAWAVVGMRVNTECAGCRSEAEIALYEASFAQAGEGTNLVRNGNFAGGLSNWGFEGTASRRVAASDAGTGRALYLEASQDQSALLNAAPFSITGGTEFTANFRGRVAPGSEGAGNFVIIFLDGDRNELTRRRIQIEPGFQTSPAPTGPDGVFDTTIDLSQFTSDQFLLQAFYPGIDVVDAGSGTGLWPAKESQRVELP